MHATGAGDSAEAGGIRFRVEGGTLYVVATPLGNLRDVTLRALDVLGSADVIAAEDTRVTAVLLRHYGIMTRPLALHEHNEARRAAHIVELLRAGKSVALVSDAGTPAVSDPGARLVAAVREAGSPVIPIPGANAAVAAISAAGLAADRFVFLGFLPTAAKARRELLACVAPLADGARHPRGAASRRGHGLAVGRSASPETARSSSRARSRRNSRRSRACRLPTRRHGSRRTPNRRRGEFVLIVDAPAVLPRGEVSPVISPDHDRLLRALVAELPPARAARVAAAATGLPREVAYARARALKGETD